MSDPKRTNVCLTPAALAAWQQSAKKMNITISAMLRCLMESANWLEKDTTKIVVEIPNHLLGDREKLMAAFEEIVDQLTV